MMRRVHLRSREIGIAKSALFDIVDREEARPATSKLLLAMTSPLLVTTGHSRSKNGVASLAYDPVAHAESACVTNPAKKMLHVGMDCRIKFGNDEEEMPTRAYRAPYSASPSLGAPTRISWKRRSIMA
jgi:hypothetical protein